MIVIVFGSVIAGLLASMISISFGTSILFACVAYAGIGSTLMALVCLRAAVCLFLERKKRWGDKQVFAG